jgi:hypothetical protein
MTRSARFFAALPLLAAALFAGCGKSPLDLDQGSSPTVPGSEGPQAPAAEPFPGPLDGTPWVPSLETVS